MKDELHMLNAGKALLNHGVRGVLYRNHLNQPFTPCESLSKGDIFKHCVDMKIVTVIRLMASVVAGVIISPAYRHWVNGDLPRYLSSLQFVDNQCAKHDT